MSKSSAVITCRIDTELLEMLDALAVKRERTRGWLIGKAVRRFVEEEVRFDAFLQAGEDSIDRGDYFTQEQMEAWFEERYRAADAA
ncbi:MULTISPECIES: CopG family ribbon-helix-helix protein [unclassified Sphingomonas]|uniref:CopG family ribbon-helix-helix protein n=1 Tax=unclassified Sphingomonas TaxID=196159 RepID=UPI000BD10FD1|nr:MAG: hypothetical protein B7Z43_02985 [Sphingomonas sp. 12-62-6]OYX39280.1 MAG: hypothetical protein B7Y98_04885 [Sphingomonas sp. 32-62-10]OYY66151.1 MAG: hypothetical protein B7Y49_03880 [Sphingomonas sp. 28-62-11]